MNRLGSARAVGISGCLRAAVVLAAAALTLGPAALARADSGPLADPTNNDAMLNLLMQNGILYETAENAGQALRYSSNDATLVINDDETDLSTADIAELASGVWGRVIILTSESEVLDAFAPGVTVGGSVNTAGRTPASCVASDAVTAGAVAAGDVLMPDSTLYYTLPPAAGASASASASADGSGSGSDIEVGLTGCYPVQTNDGRLRPTMVTLFNTQTTGDVVILGSTTFTENQYLADDGDAALALNVFGAHTNLVWLAASFTEDPNLGACGGYACGGGRPNGSGAGGGSQTQQPNAPPGGGGASAQQVNSLLPHWIWWAVLQLAVAALALAYWRARRMGRLVTEPLPVRIRAAETVEGHANLYRRASAHSRAAGLLRAAAAERIAPLLGLPAGPAGRAPQSLVAPLAARLGRSTEEVRAVLVGDVPQTEAELVRLTDQLDRLEQEVRSR